MRSFRAGGVGVDGSDFGEEGVEMSDVDAGSEVSTAGKGSAAGDDAGGELASFSVKQRHVVASKTNNATKSFILTTLRRTFVGSNFTTKLADLPD